MVLEGRLYLDGRYVFIHRRCGVLRVLVKGMYSTNQSYVDSLRLYPGIGLEGLSIITKSLIQDNRCTSQDSIWEHPEYRSETLLPSICSINPLDSFIYLFQLCTNICRIK